MFAILGLCQNDFLPLSRLTFWITPLLCPADHIYYLYPDPFFSSITSLFSPVLSLFLLLPLETSVVQACVYFLAGLHLLGCEKGDLCLPHRVVARSTTLAPT